MAFPQNATLEGFIKRLTSRSALSEQELLALHSLRGHVVTLSPHTDLVRQGQHVEYASLVVKGLVGRFGQNKDGGRQITCFHIPGDMADLSSLVSPQATWGLTTLANTTILRLAHRDLRGAAATLPGIAEAFWRDCVADGSMLSEWLVNVGRRNATSRLAHLFCEMGIRYELAGEGDRHCYRLPATQTDLGDATGLTAIHINRTLRSLRDLLILTLRAQTVTVLDWAKLAVIGDFDDAYMELKGGGDCLYN
jgi:CRP-like cAMP-binding protein